MTNEELLREISALPKSAREFIERYVSIVKSGAEKPALERKNKPFRDEPAFGMWKDREDMKEGGAAWVRKLRNEHWKP